MWHFKRGGLKAAIIIIGFLAFPGISLAGTAVNIPIGSWIYRDLERLEVKGMIKSGLLSSRPFSRLEGARLIQEAIETSERLAVDDGQVQGIVKRLKREFREELSEHGRAAISVKPVETVYLKYLYGSEDPVFPEVNNNGDVFKEGSNLRAGFVTEINLLDTLSLYLNPEYRHDEDRSRGELLHGYATLNLANIEIQGGRDSLWWGSGYHGDLLITNHARPFDMVKLTSQSPFLLPWILSNLGPLKPSFFLTELEKDRDFSHAKLMGMRLDFKPTPRFQFGLSRVFMFGGEGRASLTASDWVKIFIASDRAEHSDSPINGNQIVSLDASYVYKNDIGFIPVSGLKGYVEWGAEDSSGNHTPTGRATLFGLFLDEPLWLRNTDFRVEWADTAYSERYGPRWYKHNVYTTGYRYKGNLMGHHMGTDARDLFMRVQYNFNEGALIGVEVDSERAGIHSASTTKKRWAGLDISYPLTGDVTMQAGYGFEDLEDPGNPQMEGGSTLWGEISWNF